MRLISTLLAATAVGNAVAAAAAASDLRIITYNIRQATWWPGWNELYWRDRRPLMTNQLKQESNENTLICLQEAFYYVIQDINSDLGNKWSWIGRGRDDGYKKGEYAPIFYRNDIWDVEASHVYWLSETPDRPSRSWDATQNRVVTVAELKNKASGDKLTFMCTHFDWDGKEAQAKSADIIVDLVDGYGDNPVFFAGDLNLEPNEKPYGVLTSSLTDFRTFSKGRRSGVPPHSSEKPLANDENIMTYTGFTDDEENLLIDYVFVKDPATVQASRYSVRSNLKNGDYISDHRPVIVDVQLA